MKILIFNITVKPVLWNMENYGYNYGDFEAETGRVTHGDKLTEGAGSGYLKSSCRQSMFQQVSEAMMMIIIMMPGSHEVIKGYPACFFVCLFVCFVFCFCLFVCFVLFCFCGFVKGKLFWKKDSFQQTLK